jgi:hypothetical protein
MTTDPPQEDALLECELCLQEIPLSDDRSDEVREYVAHYCGIECYQRWRAGEGQGKADA